MNWSLYMHTSIHTLPCVISCCRKMSLWSVHSCISLFILLLSKLLTPFPIRNRWETFASGYCQMEQILITTSASSVYSLQASPPPPAPLCHLMCWTLVSDADVSFWYALFCLLRDVYHFLAENGKQTWFFCRAAYLLPCHANCVIAVLWNPCVSALWQCIY